MKQLERGERKAVAACLPGDVVRVKGLSDILQTLDAVGQLDGLPFMPEMAAHAGENFVVSARLPLTCVEGSGVRFGAFKGEDVVVLDDLRCDGSAHDGCQKFCNFLWKVSWLEPSSPGADVGRAPLPAEPKAGDLSTPKRVDALLRTRSDGRYICQSSRLSVSTERMSLPQRLAAIIVGWRVVSMAAARVVARRLEMLWWRVTNRKVERRETPLRLRPGQTVKVRSAGEIIRTLDHKATHRGLVFPRAMLAMCDQAFTVKSRVERMIREDTGAMILLKDTVLLEGAVCDGATCNGHCTRRQYYYWREDWLEPAGAAASADPR